MGGGGRRHFQNGRIRASESLPLHQSNNRQVFKTKSFKALEINERLETIWGVFIQEKMAEST